MLAQGVDPEKSVCIHVQITSRQLHAKGTTLICSIAACRMSTWRAALLSVPGCHSCRAGHAFRK